MGTAQMEKLADSCVMESAAAEAEHEQPPRKKLAVARPDDVIIRFHRREDNSWVNVQDHEDVSDKGGVKHDWPCHLCMHNSAAKKHIQMFHGVGPGRFKIFCNQCARMGGMLDFVVGEGAQALTDAFLAKKR